MRETDFVVYKICYVGFGLVGFFVLFVSLFFPGPDMMPLLADGERHSLAEMTEYALRESGTLWLANLLLLLGPVGFVMVSKAERSGLKADFVTGLFFFFSWFYILVYIAVWLTD